MRLEDCPVRAALDVIGGKWKPVILYHLMTGKKRFGELQKLIPEATQKMLTQQLRELAEDDVVVRHVYPTVPPKVEYAFSAKGRALRPALRALCQWSQTHRAPRKAAREAQVPTHPRSAREPSPTELPHPS